MIDPTAKEPGYLVTTSVRRDYQENISWSHGFFGAVANGVNQKVCWFLNYYYNLEPTDGYRYDKFVLDHEICFNQPTGKGFKMNLFPLNSATHDDTWCENLTDFTGFNNRFAYKVWCMIYRGAFYQKLLKQHKPKVVLGFGKSEASLYYRFWGAELADKFERTLGEVTVEYCKIPETESYLIISPFFGGVYGINSASKMLDLCELFHDILGTSMPFKR